MFYFSFLHFPLSGPVLTNISLPIIPCMIVYVTNNKEPWTLILMTYSFRYQAAQLSVSAQVKYLDVNDTGSLTQFTNSHTICWK